MQIQLCDAEFALDDVALRVRGEHSWESNQRRKPLQQMRDGKRTKCTKQAEVATVMSNLVHEGERRGTSPSHHHLWSFFMASLEQDSDPV